MPIRLCCALFALVCSGLTPASAQPTEQGFVYQGRLQSAGEAFEGTAEMRFRLFDALEGGTQFGSQVNRTVFVASGGLFTESLDFGPAAFDGQALFLEIDIKAGGDAAFTTLTPRQRIAPTPIASVAQRPWTISEANAFFSGGNLGVGEVDPLAPLHLSNGPLFLNAAALFQDDLLIEDTDAILGLASNGGGAAGSGIALKEVGPDSTLVDNWSIYRSTSGALSELRMTYGPSANYATNSLKARVTTAGDMVIAGRYQTQSRLRTLNFSANTATPIDNTRLTSFIGIPELSSGDGSRDAVVLLPIDLPEGTQIKDFTMICSDFNNDSLIQMVLFKQEYGQSPVSLGSVKTDVPFDDGVTSRSRLYGINDRPVIEPDTTYYLEVRMLGGGFSSVAMGFQYARLTYITTAP